MTSIIVYSCLTVCVAYFFSEIKKLILNLHVSIGNFFQALYLFFEMLTLILYLLINNKVYKFTAIGLIVSFCVMIFFQ
ncbi:hypothetical protein DB313_05900 (plasmid) [Borrelia turcica IST7]|uniref:Uncharacterized protein n=1 Tax=Borrelia turcica IST7 TaxID=1104446 RepID=A0A386PNH1_9SPIR|nr:hypothetical protein DB313_05900 [Borrelia turcica IST7]